MIGLRRCHDRRIICNRLMTAHSFHRRALGLLGTRHLHVDSGLWLKPCRQIHTCFMRYAIDVVFIDDESCITALHATVPPGRIRTAPGHTVSTIELAAGRIRATGLLLGDRLQWFQR